MYLSPSFKMLSSDVNRKIACYLNIHDCHSMFLVNKEWAKLSRDLRFWALKLQWDYNIVIGPSVYSHTLYQERHRDTVEIFVELPDDIDQVLLAGRLIHCSKFIDPSKRYTICMPEYKVYSVSSWTLVFKTMRTLSHVPYISSMMALIKYLIRSRYPKIRSLVLCNRHFDHAIVLGTITKDDPLFIIENIVESVIIIRNSTQFLTLGKNLGESMVQVSTIQNLDCNSQLENKDVNTIPTNRGKSNDWKKIIICGTLIVLIISGGLYLGKQ